MIVTTYAELDKVYDSAGAETIAVTIIAVLVNDAISIEVTQEWSSGVGYDSATEYDALVGYDSGGASTSGHQTAVTLIGVFDE